VRRKSRGALGEEDARDDEERPAIAAMLATLIRHPSKV
jgi:hypothetical protein